MKKIIVFTGLICFAATLFNTTQSNLSLANTLSQLNSAECNWFFCKPPKASEHLTSQNS